jgi:hypothetical protein
MSLERAHGCCYDRCPRPGAIYIGLNGNLNTDWICFFHFDLWHETRARFLADGGGCEMQALGELLDQECRDEVSKADSLR